MGASTPEPRRHGALVPDRDIALPHLAITLVFWRKFGAPHWHKYSDTENDIRYHVDENMRGRTVCFIPTMRRLTFEIGRAEECYLRLGFDPESKRNPSIPSDIYDDGGAMAQPLFNHWSRKHATFELRLRQRDGKTDGDWLISSGGEFWNTKTGVREWGDAKNYVYLNGHRLPGGNDPSPLFAPGSKLAKVQLGDGGKIIISKGRLGPHTTSWPEDIWSGEGWPDMVMIARARVKAAKASVETARVVRDTSPGESPPHPMTWPDIAALILTGPPDVNRWVWWAGCAAVGTFVVWIWKN
jgi:hypothetical protein